MNKRAGAGRHPAGAADEAQRIAIDAEYRGRQHPIAGEGWRRRATLLAIPATVLIAALAAHVSWTPCRAPEGAA